MFGIIALLFVTAFLLTIKYSLSPFPRNSYSSYFPFFNSSAASYGPFGFLEYTANSKKGHFYVADVNKLILYIQPGLRKTLFETGKPYYSGNSCTPFYTGNAIARIGNHIFFILNSSQGSTLYRFDVSSENIVPLLKSGTGFPLESVSVSGKDIVVSGKNAIYISHNCGKNFYKMCNTVFFGIGKH